MKQPDHHEGGTTLRPKSGRAGKVKPTDKQHNAALKIDVSKLEKELRAVLLRHGFIDIFTPTSYTDGRVGVTILLKPAEGAHERKELRAQRGETMAVRKARGDEDPDEKSTPA